MNGKSKGQSIELKGGSYDIKDLYSIIAETVNKQKEKSITTACDAMHYLKKYAKKTQEHFLVMALDGSHGFISLNVVSIGTVNSALVHPREVFRTAIIKNATSIIIAHNHPSGNLKPSDKDIEVTKRIKEAGELMGIPLLDSIVFKDFYFSMLEEGLM